MTMNPESGSLSLEIRYPPEFEATLKLVDELLPITTPSNESSLTATQVAQLDFQNFLLSKVVALQSEPEKLASLAIWRARLKH